jgi:hypothetical protein
MMHEWGWGGGMFFGLYSESQPTLNEVGWDIVILLSSLSASSLHSGSFCLSSAFDCSMRCSIGVNLRRSTRLQQDPKVRHQAETWRRTDNSPTSRRRIDERKGRLSSQRAMART